MFFNKINGYTEDNNSRKYLILIFTDENKDILKKYDEIWSKIKNLIRLRNNNMDQ